MNKLIKRLLCGAISIGMVMSVLVLPQQALAATDPIVSVTFDEGGGAYTLHGAAVEEKEYSHVLTMSGNQYADINDVSAINSLEGDFTFSVLVNPSSDAQWTRVYDIGSGETANIFLAPSSSFGAGQPRFVIKDATNHTEQVLQSTATLNVGEWNSVVVTRASSTTTMYVNGAAAGTTTELTYDPKDAGTTTQNWLGRSQYSADPYFGGSIDDFQVYDRAITTDEIAAVQAKAEEYEAADKIEEGKQHAFEDNCYIADTHFYIDDTEIFSLAPEYLSDVYISDLSADTMSFKLYNAKSAGTKDLRAYAAEYTADGKLVKVAVKSDFSEVTSDAATNITVPFTKTNAADSVKLLVWRDMTPVSQSAPETTGVTLTAIADVKNHTTKDGTVSARLYYVDAEGNEYPLGDAVSKAINSIDEEQITLTYTGTIPVSAEKVIVKTTVPEGGATKDYTAATLYCGVKSPVTAASDPENGAHDPSIVKFPGDDTYYVYTSHHLIFTSEDLINWKKYDFAGTNASAISPKTNAYINSNYSGTTMNGTYWAPDVIYRPDDTAHPYWMYISLSCGLGGRNSVIALEKSPTPLFWADPDPSKVSAIEDAGVVFATKENSSYKTNAIDANIYTDTHGTADASDDTPYFVWGSFWGGIQAAPLTADGLVEGVTYQDGNATLTSCQNFGTSIFTQPGNGTAGPEGAWMFEHGDYRYAFTSYGWLGSNYNTRIARSPLSTSFGTNMGTQLVDANGTVMGTAISTGNLKSVPTGYKLIGSYRLGDGSRTIVNDTHNYYVQSNSGDAITYYGPGHNSAISRGDESFYVSHTRVNHAEGGATLQVRKMLFTSDGWPVVAPVTYCGEVEQALPKDMIVGTYDLASVGQTKRGDGDIGAAAGGLVDVNRNYDLPVLSSKVTLGADGKMTNADGAEIGTWTYDNDHTVTLKFTKNGDTSGNKDEFYKSGDTMTLYAMLEYDKDTSRPVVGLTGTDNHHITQLATKSAANELRTEPETIAEPAAKSITKSAGGNPELGFDTSGNTVYAGDPAATVIDTDNDGEGDTVYLIVGHDTTTDSVTNADAGYTMPNWLLYTSTDMTNWEYKGSVLECSSISWASNKNAAWASQMVPYNGKYYLYFCTWDNTSGGKQSIGVAVADSPEGPYKDIGHPLVKGDFTTPESSGWNDIDPTVLIDKDADGNEHRYLAWGNGKYYICELNEDMTSVKDIDGDGDIVMHKDIKEKKIKSMNGGVFTEAPWLYKRNGKYYLFYAMNWREEMAYAMTDDPFNGRYDFKQIIMPPTATSNTNHPSVIDFNGKTYFIYHNGALPNGFGFRRSVCIDELKFDNDGYVYPVTETSIGLTGTASTIKTKSGKYVGHSTFENSLGDAAYPIHTNVTVSDAENAYATAWEIMPAKAKKGEADYDNYVSIQSVDKPGLYISSTGSGVELTQDIENNMNDKMTFKTVNALNGDADGVSFVSVSDPGKYLTVLGDTLTLSFGQDADAATFTVGAATAKPNPEIRVATPETDPLPDDDITQNFDTTAGTLISATDASAKTYTALNGVTLYIGNKGGDNQPTQNFAIETGGVTGNALVLNAGKYQSASRGGRMQITTPVIPDGDTVTAEFKTKLVNGSSGAAKLYFNDSTGSIDDNSGNLDAGTHDTNLTADNNWHTVKIAIKNEDDTYFRTVSVDGTAAQSDYVDEFPVFWGTIANSTSAKVYFDDLSITTTDAEGNTPTPPEVELPEPTSKFEFDDNLTDSIENTDGTLVSEKITTGAAATAAQYDTGYDNSGKALKLTGTGGYGVSLGKVITDRKYTVAFRMKANAFTSYTAAIFIDSGDATTQKWVSAPIGWRTVGDDPDANKYLKVWSNNGAFIDLISNFIPETDTWYYIAIAADGGTAKMYVDGKQVGNGPIADVITSDTTTYLGVNYWDTPFNGLIDDVYIYNGTTLSDAQVKKLCTE